MKSINSFACLVAILAMALISGAACSAATTPSGVANANRLLSEAGLSGDYWHSEISDAGKDSQSQSWIVGAYEKPEEMKNRVCVAPGKVWVLSKKNNAPSKVEIKSSENTSLMYVATKLSKNCDAIPPEEYFLVEPAIPYSDALSLIDDITDSLSCIRKDSQCKGWSHIDIKSESTRLELNDYPNLIPFTLESLDPGTLELSYRYSVMSSDKNYLVFTVSRRANGVRSLRINLRPFEAE